MKIILFKGCITQNHEKTRSWSLIFMEIAGPCLTYPDIVANFVVGEQTGGIGHGSSCSCSSCWASDVVDGRVGECETPAVCGHTEHDLRRRHSSVNPILGGPLGSQTSRWPCKGYNVIADGYRVIILVCRPIYDVTTSVWGFLRRNCLLLIRFH